MYKLLLVTDQDPVRDAFQGMTAWDRSGFRPPRIAGDTRSAMDSLERHYADAIAIALPPEDEAVLIRFLGERYPDLPIMRASADADVLARDVRELSQLLNRTHADYSNDRYSLSGMMQLCRHEYFRKLLSGQVTDEAGMRRMLRLLRSRMDPDMPCVLMKLDFPEDDGYLAAHWRYGPDRLEVAMRNIFGAELQGMRILVSVLPDERLYLLACPMLGSQIPEDESMTSLVVCHAEESIRHVSEYLDIDLKIASVTVYPKLTALISQQ